MKEGWSTRAHRAKGSFATWSDIAWGSSNRRGASKPWKGRKDRNLVTPFTASCGQGRWLKYAIGDIAMYCTMAARVLLHNERLDVEL